MEATEIVVSSQIPGLILDVYVSEGTWVTERQAVAQIDTEKIELQRRQILAGLGEMALGRQTAQKGLRLAQDQKDNAEKKFQRIKALYEGDSVPRQQYEDMETAYKAAVTQFEEAVIALQTLDSKEEQLRIQLALAERQLRDARIVSPIDGVVLEKYREKGEIVALGGSVASIADVRHMWIKIYLQEGEAGRIRLNDTAALSVTAYPDSVFRGRVAWISPKAEFTPKMVQTREARTDLVYAVKIEVENPNGIFKIGMPADVEINPAE